MTTRDPFQVALSHLLSKASYGSQNIYAKKAGIDPQYISQLKNGSKKGAEATRRAVAGAMGYEYEAFLILGQQLIEGVPLTVATESATMDAYVPVQETSVIIRPDANHKDEDHEDCEYAFRSDWLQKYGGSQHKVLIRIIGEAMDPTLKPGDMVMVDKGVNHLIAGQLYLVRLGDTAVVRRVDFMPNRAGIVLRSDNPNKHFYPDITIPLPLENKDVDNPLLGILIWVGRELVSSDNYR